MKNKKHKRKKNGWKIIWTIGIYSVLILILCLVVDYKVEWESRDLNRYLYFYECAGKLCTSDIPQENYYNRILCEEKICPYIVEQKNQYLILSNGNKQFIYDYKSNKILNDDYIEYYFIKNEMIAMKDENGAYGLMDMSFNIITEPKYSLIVDYMNGYLIYNEEGKYGLKNVIVNKDIISGYDEISFANERYVSLKKNNLYTLYCYNTKKENAQIYNYLYSYNNYTFAFYENKIDILDENTNSILVKKINTYYKYLTKKEQKSLNFRLEDNILLFNIVDSKNEYLVYKFDLSTGKLIN